VPWHYNNIAAVDTAKQTLLTLDGIMDMVQLKLDGPLGKTARELKERAVLFLEEIVAMGGYFKAVEAGMFVDSGFYPERNGDGIVRKADAGIGVGTVVPRDADYMAPVCEHFGYNNLPTGLANPCDLIGGCTLCDPDKIQYIDELDENDNAETRMGEFADHRAAGLIRPEVQWYGDGYVAVTLCLPVGERVAEYAALEIAKKMNLADPEVIHKGRLHPAEGTLIELKGRVTFDIDPRQLVIPEEPLTMSEAEIAADIKCDPMTIVAATVGNDEHSVGMREIIDIKHGGIEKFGIKAHYLGTSVPVEKVVDAAIETDAQAILISTIITHADVHRLNMKRLHDLCVEKGIRDRIILIAGGTQITNEAAVECGMDAGFGRGTHGINVASFLVKRRAEKGI
jgi:D-ornithine 4,5-aminomutase subunit beta